MELMVLEAEEAADSCKSQSQFTLIVKEGGGKEVPMFGQSGRAEAS